MKISVVGSRSPYPAFDSVLSILKDVLGSENVMEIRIKDWVSETPSALKPLLYFLQDLMIYLKILSTFNKANVILIYQGYYPLTCIGVKILRLKLLLYVGGSAFRSSYHDAKTVLKKVLAYSNIPIQNICHRLSDRIILPHKGMLKWLDLRQYIKKINYALGITDVYFFIKFKKVNDYRTREKLVGYVGSLSESKGVFNLLRGIYIINTRASYDKIRDECLKFILVGSGSLLDDSTRVLKSELPNNVILTGYVPHKLLPEYYNQMKLLILPSYSEGLPSVVLEAMACGTPVLATPVGAIPDIIKDGETGFLLNSNDPKNIANKIIELLNQPELLEKASINAYNYVRENFGYERTLESWRKILSELVNERQN